MKEPELHFETLGHHLQDLFNLFSYVNQNHMARGCTSYSELGSAISIINQENEPQTSPKGQCGEDAVLVEVSSSQTTLAVSS